MIDYSCLLTRLRRITTQVKPQNVLLLRYYIFNLKILKIMEQDNIVKRDKELSAFVTFVFLIEMFNSCSIYCISQP